ncbi:unnamed protein product [Lampetra fluviatilis]
MAGGGGEGGARGSRGGATGKKFKGMEGGASWGNSHGSTSACCGDLQQDISHGSTSACCGDLQQATITAPHLPVAVTCSRQQSRLHICLLR